MKIGELILAWRNTNRMGVREASKLIGVSPATLSRIEHNKPIDGKTMQRLITWVFIDGF